MSAVLEETLAAIRPADQAAMRAAQERQSRLTKPPGSLGALETESIRLAGLAGECPPPLAEPAAVAVFAADHGVHAQGVSPWPQEVTGQMVANFAVGGAVVNAIARQSGAEVMVVDVGVAAELPPAVGVLARKVRPGTADITVEAAMSRAEAVRAIEVGIEVARLLYDTGNRCLLTGDMGIANTTASAALIAAFTGADPAAVTGRGTGIDDAMYDRKIQVVQRALSLHSPDPADPVGVLAAVGGLEHAALAGFVLGAAALRVPVVLDGVIACSAALAARAVAADSVAAMVAGHRSAEPGAAIALASLGLRPLVDLDLRLGEGSGAVLALPLVQSAVRVLREVATFDSAGVTDKNVSPAAAEGPRPAGRRVLVLGGARSGKSAEAEALLSDVDTVDYVAPGPLPAADDPEWTARVAAHRASRPASWRTHETRDLVPLLAEDTSVPLMVDCLSTWLSGVMDDCGLWAEKPDADQMLADRVDSLVSAWQTTGRQVVAVSNEVGSGVVPPTPAGRRFRDELGRVNARIAAVSDQVVHMIAGIPTRLK
ncbi:nicotinate-nucleotide--dimethylbenzimidazole phosphoribosyltransferase [Fodinicola acaciae]|uniref:nicotinate-nucleotide--dimethylbenzimidazole phosphoribosyltransferase n=1 Tax=Fodinicola acaciae TaxID=2681555 RepID=UPI0013D82277|nr:nicotinate-nucleotide--dimethylbenzimidazole phosphoribosyltransferase [Fodinicola acaciae]